MGCKFSGKGLLHRRMDEGNPAALVITWARDDYYRRSGRYTRVAEPEADIFTPEKEEEIASPGSTVLKVRRHERVGMPESDQQNESQAAGDQPGGRCAHDFCDHDVHVSHKA